LSKFSRDRENPFRVIPRIFFGLAAVVLTVRLLTPYQYPHFHFSHYYPTHLRMDSLFFGVFISYFHHFRPQVIPELLKSQRVRVGLAVLSVALLVPCLFIDISNFFMLTFGFTLLYLGFGGVLVLALYCPIVWPRLLRTPMAWLGSALAYVGMNSYSIYLWHPAAQSWGLHKLVRIMPFRSGVVAEVVIYVTLSLALGITMAKLIEFPVLKLRQRLYPSRIPEVAVVSEVKARLEFNTNPIDA
jgi:peptidoglycan/LPS O-acetylase OafA/YrhL